MKNIALLASVLSFLALPALAETKVFEITIKDHKFAPETVEVPAGEKVKLLIKNQDAAAEEFDSHDLKREKVISANSEASVLVGPLKAGEYNFVGEYHEDTAKGKLVAK